MPAILALRTRLLPAVLTAAGVTLLAGGLLSYTGPVDAAGARPDPSEPVATAALPTPSPSGDVAASLAPSASVVPEDRVPTRVVVPALRIDLPVVEPNDGYPLCNVAMYYPGMGQPGAGKATYLYAHARDGMFGPIYRRAIPQNRPNSMVGMLVEVYTSDDQLFLYEIVEVRRHQTTFDDAVNATTEQLWLQTSEGPRGTAGKTQVIATFLSSGAADPKDAHPKAKPVVCG